MHEELGATLGAAVYERRGDRRGYRNGTKARTLTGPTGPLALTLPRATLFTPTGPKEWTSALVPRYQRRIREVNEAVVATYLAGGNTRRLRAALGPLLKQAPLSRSTVSRIVATLRSSLEAWQARSLTKLGAVYLYLDALALRVRSAGKVVSVPVLGAVAVGSDGQKQLVGLELWGRVVRGLEGFPRQPQRPGAGGSAAEHHRRARGAPPRCRGGLAPGGGAALLRALSPASPIYAHRAMVREPQECALSTSRGTRPSGLGRRTLSMTGQASETTTIVEQPPQTETIVCYFCGSPDFTRLFCSRDRLHRVPGEYWVVRCNHCGLVYLNPRPSPARMRAHYPPHYVINQFRPAAKNAPLRQRLVAHQLERIDRLKLRRVLAACPLDSHAHVLDVGCNLGTFLAALRDRTGCSVVGLEPAPTPAHYAREHFHLDVREACLEDVADSFAPASFDLITLWHVLEHLWAPRRDLQIIRTLLKPGGTLIVEVPNFGDPLRRLFGGSWAYVDVPRHLLHFTPRTLRNVLEDAGFAIGTLERDGTFRAYSVTISSLFTLFGLGYEPDLEKSAYAATCIRYATWPLFTLEGLLGMRGLLTAISTPRGQTLPADPQAHRRAPAPGADA